MPLPSHAGIACSTYFTINQPSPINLKGPHTTSQHWHSLQIAFVQYINTIKPSSNYINTLVLVSSNYSATMEDFAPINLKGLHTTSQHSLKIALYKTINTIKPPSNYTNSLVLVCSNYSTTIEEPAPINLKGLHTTSSTTPCNCVCGLWMH